MLGTDQVPPVVAFKEGYENGAKYINPDINVIATYNPGGLDTAFNDPEWGATTARQASTTALTSCSAPAATPATAR